LFVGFKLHNEIDHAAFAINVVHREDKMLEVAQVEPTHLPIIEIVVTVCGTDGSSHSCPSFPAGDETRSRVVFWSEFPTCSRVAQLLQLHRYVEGAATFADRIQPWLFKEFLTFTQQPVLVLSGASALVSNLNNDGPELLVPDRTIPVQGSLF
jgi:hypothetical protein